MVITYMYISQVGVVRNIIYRDDVIYFHIPIHYTQVYKETCMKFKKISPLTSYTQCTDKSDDGGSCTVYIYIRTLSPSFCRHFFSLSLLFFQNINLAQCAVYTYTLTIRFFGPPNTQSDTELFIDKLHRTSASEIYIYFFFILLFYSF